jgi:DNA-binding protein
LQKDAVYCAIYITAPVIQNQLDFDALLRSNLVDEVQVKDPQFKILRRRIAMLLGKWTPIKLAEQSKPLVYQIFHHLLNPEDEVNDQVVRVTAGRQLSNVVEAWEFEPKPFLPYIDDVLTRLMALIEEVELQETKMALLNTISVLSERMEEAVSTDSLQ